MASGENSNSFSNKPLASTRRTLSGVSPLALALLRFSESAPGRQAVGSGAPSPIHTDRRGADELYRITHRTNRARPMVNVTVGTGKSDGRHCKLALPEQT